MLNTAYKIYAKALANRMVNHLKIWVKEEQKGFIKGRFILEAIISLWEGLEYAQESKQDLCFLEKFISYVSTLFGNARVRISINGELTEAFFLTKSITQGCPLSQLLYAIATNGLTNLVREAMQKGQMRGLHLPGSNKQMCLHLFADDTNVLVSNEETFCLASGSSINHQKKLYPPPPPPP